ncbi:MAG TPA: 30S ribosomal protein S16 [Anseongella sp.]|nr:30S ribosomal protein S16 [Anseongella sp.]
MPVKIRLQRHGKKGRAFYQVVVADSRAPRDGKFIERLGTYDPNTNPATISLNLVRSVQWLENGAQPTDTARAILSYKGALYKHHLQVGVRKGAFTQEEAEAKFAEWLEGKESRVEAKKSKLSSSAEEIERARKAAESKKKEERARAIAAKNTPPADEEEVPEAEEAAPEAVAEAAPEAPETAPAEEAASAPPEAAAEAPAEAAAEEASPEEPVAETPAEETAPEAEEESPAAEETDGEKDKKAE